MVSKNNVKPVLHKLFGGKFDGEVFWHHLRNVESIGIDPKRIDWGAIYRHKEHGEECQEGIQVLHFVEEIHIDEALRRLPETDDPCFCASVLNWLEQCFIQRMEKDKATMN